MDEKLNKLQLRVEVLQTDLTEIKKLVKELHAVVTGKFCNPERRLTAKEKREAKEAELNRIRFEAHTRALNKFYKKGC